MTATVVALLAATTVVTLVVLAVAIVLVVDRVRATADRVLAVRDDVVPAVERLVADATAVQERAAALRAVRVRDPDGAGGARPRDR